MKPINYIIFCERMSMFMNRQILRSKEHRVIAGVCGGFAEYFNIDPTVIRLIWIAISLTAGVGILAYIIAAIIIPDKPANYRSDENQSNPDSGFNAGTNDWGKPAAKFDSDKSRLLIGGILVILGVFFLTREFFGWFNFKYFWPAAFIIIGGLLIFKGRRNSV
jgi:phage shock protein PspC (stress-responsive transcriptional regulator)